MKLSRSVYLDKTTAGFLGQVVGALSGFEFARRPDGALYVGMPDAWFRLCRGPYGDVTPYINHTVKRVYNDARGQWETWLDDDFAVDVFNQFILDDSFRATDGFSARFITDGWRKYDIYDMGGGHHEDGAHGLIERHGFLPPFAGSAEAGNKYSYCTEPFLGADLFGLNCPMMPEKAASLAAAFGCVTGDRDNVEWARYFAALYALAYGDDPIPDLIRAASRVFPAGATALHTIDRVFDFYRYYPDDWRAAFVAFERENFVDGVTRQTSNTINCGFVLLGLLYGKGDFAETAKIMSLAGYDCESTAGMALTVCGIRGGMTCLPSEVNEWVWQDGKGILINDAPEGLNRAYWMCARHLPREMPITDVIDLYLLNFRRFLAEAGGSETDTEFDIPACPLLSYDAAALENPGFEKKLAGFTATGVSAVLSDLAATGRYAVRLSGEGWFETVATGLVPGKTYRLSVLLSAEGGAAFLYAKTARPVAVSLDRTVAPSAHPISRSVPRSVVFVADAESVPVGIRTVGDVTVIADDFTLVRVEETPLGTVSVIPDGDGFALALNADTAGADLTVRLTYQNETGTAQIYRAAENGKERGAILFGKTADCGDFTVQNTVSFPLWIAARETVVRFTPEQGGVTVTKAEILSVKDRF